MPGVGEPGLRCPSAQPAMTDAQVLGVVSHDGDGPRVAYLNEFVAVTDELLALSAPSRPGEVFRLAARCEASRCTHFDGERCALATRIVTMLPEVTERLPPCAIRANCRWYQQEERAACMRCPQIVTHNLRADQRLQMVAGGEGAVTD